jgi:transcription termination factor Rho
VVVALTIIATALETVSKMDEVIFEFKELRHGTSIRQNISADVFILLSI